MFTVTHYVGFQFNGEAGVKAYVNTSQVITMQRTPMITNVMAFQAPSETEALEIYTQQLVLMEGYCRNLGGYAGAAGKQ